MQHLQSVVGVFALLGIAWIISEDRHAVAWKRAAIGLVVTFATAVVLLKVPGAPRAWADLHARFGKLPFEKLFEPAIAYARHGYFVSPIISRLWGSAATKTYGPLPGAEFEPWRQTFT